MIPKTNVTVWNKKWTEYNFTCHCTKYNPFRRNIKFITGCFFEYEKSCFSHLGRELKTRCAPLEDEYFWQILILTFSRCMKLNLSDVQSVVFWITAAYIHINMLSDFITEPYISSHSILAFRLTHAYINPQVAWLIQTLII